MDKTQENQKMSNNSGPAKVNGEASPVVAVIQPASSSGQPPPPSAVNNTAIERLQQLEALFLGGPIMSSATTNSEAKCFSTETLLDVLMVLYNECCNSSLRKEKTVSEFIELGKKQILFCFFHILGINRYVRLIYSVRYIV